MFHTGHTQQHLARAIPQAISGGGSSFVTAASSICRVELVAICTCAIASQGPFTHGTGELFSSRRLASRGRRASHGYYLPVACEHARIRSPRCGVCMLYLWAISGIGSSFGAAVSCICQLSAVQQGGKRNYAIWQASRWIRRPAPCAVRVTGTDLIFAHIQLSVHYTPTFFHQMRDQCIGPHFRGHNTVILYSSHLTTPFNSSRVIPEARIHLE